MDNLQKVKLVVLVGILLFIVPVSYMFYTKNPYEQAPSSAVTKLSISNKEVLEERLINNTYSYVEKSLIAYFDNLRSNPGELTIVDGDVQEKYGTYQFYLANSTGDKTFRVDVLISGFDTTGTYINGVRW